MMKNRLLLTVLAAALCAAPSFTRAQDAVPPKPPGSDAAPAPSPEKKPGEKPDAKPERGAGRGGPPIDPAERLKFMTEKLNLTAEQQEKIKAIYEKNGPQIRELMSKGRDNLNDADKAKLRDLMKTQREEVDAVLTPEQREKARELRGSGPGGDRKPGEGRKRPEAR